jgi:hypothetical protein
MARWASETDELLGVPDCPRSQYLAGFVDVIIHLSEYPLRVSVQREGSSQHKYMETRKEGGEPSAFLRTRKTDPQN